LELSEELALLVVNAVVGDDRGNEPEAVKG
jgi:hypothetical protein